MAQDLSRRLKARFAAPRTGFAFAGFDVPHAHAHVMPMFSIADLTSQKCFAEENLTFRPPPRADDGALAALAQELHRDLSQDAEGQLHRGLPQDAADKLHRGLPQDAEEKSRKL
jgi:histidine triad (HIT) family protein